jgi:hypothetical protein
MVQKKPFVGVLPELSLEMGETEIFLTNADLEESIIFPSWLETCFVNCIIA